MFSFISLRVKNSNFYGRFIYRSYKSNSNIPVITDEEKHAEFIRKENDSNGMWDDDPKRSNFFGVFQSSKTVSADLRLLYKSIQADFNFSHPIEGTKKAMENLKFYNLLEDQKYIDERMHILGNDLGAAYFIIYRRGKVKFRGIKDWVQLNRNTKKPSTAIPNVYDANFIVEEIDLSNLPIVYDGLQSIENLYQLKSANFSNCQYLDDWCIDRICGQNYVKLEHLDISYCPKVTDNGVAQLSKLRSLKTLNVAGLNNVDHLPLLCLMLQDCTPNLRIEGLPTLDKIDMVS